jgi:predicted phosphodiesterase
MRRMCAERSATLDAAARTTTRPCDRPGLLSCATPMRLALRSDIHGNLPALEAVLEDAQSRAVDQIVNLGDSLAGPLLARETASFLMRQPWLQIAGNHERQMLELVGQPAEGGESDRYALAELDPSALRWLSSLPKTARIGDDVLLCHGTPHDDCQGLLDSVDAAGIRIATPAEIAQRIEGVGASLIACGHTHLPRAMRTTPGGTVIVNPGSVGHRSSSG